jgi:hypothetical protein
MAIKDSIYIKTNSRLKDIVYEKDGDSWYLTFDNDISFSFYTIWRLFKNDIVTLISNDHGHQFGLPKPVDLILDLKSSLDNKTLKEICVEKNSGDLYLNFDEDVKLIAYVSSMGYESFQFSANGKQFIGQGGGDITTFN